MCISTCNTCIASWIYSVPYTTSKSLSSPPTSCSFNEVGPHFKHRVALMKLGLISTIRVFKVPGFLLSFCVFFKNIPWNTLHGILFKCLPESLCYVRYPVKILKGFVLSPTVATCPAPFSFLDLIQKLPVDHMWSSITVHTLLSWNGQIQQCSGCVELQTADTESERCPAWVSLPSCVCGLPD